MIKTILAYRELVKSKFWFVLLFIIFLVSILLTSLFVFKVNKDIQDSLISILSILFPLIAGFLTFGRDTLKSITKSIDNIKYNDNNDIGAPVTDTDKKEIRDLKIYAKNFIGIVTSTFFVSFILIIILIVAKFNTYLFQSSNTLVPIKDFLYENWGHLLFKVVFFYLIYTMLLNTLYLTIFIMKVANNKLVD